MSFPSVVFLSVMIFGICQWTVNSSSSDSSSSSSEEVEEYGAQGLCSGYYDAWDPIDTPLEDKDFRGRLNYITDETRLRALTYITEGIQYDLGFPYNQSATSFKADSFSTLLDTITIGVDHFFFQSLQTLAHGNTGTQFDHLCHIAMYDGGSVTDNNNYVMFNNVRENELKLNSGFQPGFCLDVMGPVVSTVHLFDVAGYLNVTRMSVGEEITEALFYDVLDYQNMLLSDIQSGDIVMFYTGHGQLYHKPSEYYNGEPGIGVNLVKNVFYDLNVSIIAGDGWGVEVAPADNFPSAHRFWLVCAGGGIQESLNLEAWIQDARKDFSKFQAAYFYNPIAINGAPCSMGAPFVIV